MFLPCPSFLFLHLFFLFCLSTSSIFFSPILPLPPFPSFDIAASFHSHPIPILLLPLLFLAITFLIYPCIPFSPFPFSFPRLSFTLFPGLSFPRISLTSSFTILPSFHSHSQPFLSNSFTSLPYAFLSFLFVSFPSYPFFIPSSSLNLPFKKKKKKTNRKPRYPKVTFIESLLVFVEHFSQRSEDLHHSSKPV